MPASSEKLSALQKMLEKQPGDTFLLYAMGMEFKKLDDPTLAIDYFNKVITIDPGYCYAYYQRGQVQESIGETSAAKSSYAEGIAASERVGDAHAKGELEAALQMLD